MHYSKREENMLVISKSTTSVYTVLHYRQINLISKKTYLFIYFINFFFQKTIESETVKTSEILKKKLENISETVKEVKLDYSLMNY